MRRATRTLSLIHIFYGREHVIYLVGVNKLAPTLEAAIDRARNVAAPLNARRLHCQTPCALADPMRCHDCHSPDRICKGYVVQTRPMGGIDVYKRQGGKRGSERSNFAAAS